MNMKKLFVFLTAAFAICTVYAQKPTSVLVWAEPCRDTENRISSLLVEYYKSELATHSGLVLVSAAQMEQAMKKLKHPGAGTPDAKAIQSYCKETDSSVFCSVSLVRKGKKFEVIIKIFDAAGKHKKTINRAFETIKESDLLSVQSARDTAVAIRGVSPVDVVHNEREIRLKKELEEDLKEAAK